MEQQPSAESSTLILFNSNYSSTEHVGQMMQTFIFMHQATCVLTSSHPAVRIMEDVPQGNVNVMNIKYRNEGIWVGQSGQYGAIKL